MGLGWRYPAAFPRLQSLIWRMGSTLASEDVASDVQHLLHGRQLTVLRFFPNNGISDDPLTVGPWLVDLLTAAAALPATLEVGVLWEWTGEQLLRLTDSTPQVAPTRDLNIAVADLTAATLGPLARIPRLARLTLVVAAGGGWFDAFPNFPALEVLPVSAAGGGGPAALPAGGGGGCGGAFVWALAASTARHTLNTISLHGISGPPSKGVEAAVGAAAPHLVALRRLTMDGAVWCFAGGRVVGRWGVGGGGQR